MNEIKNKLRESSPGNRMENIIAFMKEHIDLSEAEMLKVCKDEVEQGNEVLAGIVRIEKVFTPWKFQETTLIIIDKEHWPDAVNLGTAYSEDKFVFIRDEIPDRAYRAVLDHELYHIDHEQESIGGRLNKILPGAIQIHEAENILVGLLRDGVGLTQAHALIAKELLDMIARDNMTEIRHLRSQISRLLNR